MPEQLRSSEDQRLWIVQFRGTPTQEGRDAIGSCGGEVHGYLPSNAYVVRMGAGTAAAVGVLPQVRWVGAYHPAYRIDPALQSALEQGQLPPAAQYNLVVVDKHRDKPVLGAEIRAIGGGVVHEQPGSLLFTVALTPAQLVQAAFLDEVLWIDAVTETGTDMDNARIQGGGNYVEAQAGYTGAGVNAHIYEGIEANHQDFTGGATNVRSGGGADTHGHCTAGIVFGNGTSNPAVRGMAPDCTKFYTQYSSVSSGWSRWQVVQELVNVYQVSHTTASWGDARTLNYTSVSADTDDIIFDHGIAWTQSQSNAGNQQSRPQAWAKNIFSIGGVQHFNNSNPLDDSWAAGGGSTGPAADGRIKPDLCAYYDAIGTSDRTGSAGYSSGNWYASFGGTSGATPIVAGHNVLAIQMFTDETGHPGFGAFGNQLRVPNGTAFQNRPKCTTLKSLQIASAHQYAFNASSTNNTRTQVGWGFPSLQSMWDNRAKTFIVDETDVITQGNSTRWDIAVGPGEPELKASLNYADPAANPAAAITLINNLSLRVTSPTGAVYWGNHALQQGNYSTTGGAEDNINPTECVFVQNPQAGTWHVDVIATSIVADSHVETPAMDADYGLVVVGGTGGTSTSAFFFNYGQGCAGSTNVVTPCAELNPNGGTLTGLTDTNEYLFVVSGSVGMQVQSFDLFTQSTGGTQVRPVHIYTSLSSGASPVASSTMSIGPTPGFYRASFPTPVSVGSSFYLVIDVSSQNVVVPNLTSGATGVAFYRSPSASNWTYAAAVTRPAWRVDCTAGTHYFVPTLGHNGTPVLGTSYDLTLTDALASSAALMMTGLSDSSYNGTPLPYALPNAPGCELLAAPMATTFTFTSGTGTATHTVNVPSSSSYIGLELFHQWAVLDPANGLGIVVSDAGVAHVGT
ncbi:MAG: S8 family serine peptidase [Planctomycetes bacterium]|nr:S8 family serine peptidase [Planctomycetota bacterium]